MKNIRLKIILLLCLFSTGLVVFSWIQNSYQIDFFLTKNLHYHNRMIEGIKDSNDIDFVKMQAIQVIEGIDNNAFNKNNRAIKESKIQIVIFLLLLVISVLTLMEIRRKTQHNKN